MEASYWETKSWFSEVDFTVVGSGLVGLFCALELKAQNPKAKVLVLEKGTLPAGASTKNAGFACYGSASELLEDLNHHSEEEVQNLVQQRYNGLQLLRKTLGDSIIGYENKGGFEIFNEDQNDLLDSCRSQLPRLNELLRPVFGRDVFQLSENSQGFSGVGSTLIQQREEGQIDTGKMMTSLLQGCHKEGVLILNNTTLHDYEDDANRVHLDTSLGSFSTGNLCIATNGFAAQLGIGEVKPARAQVLVTKPIKDLPFQGAYHLDRGYYYFRDVGQRILLGGGRNLDFKGEETSQQGTTALIQDHLERLLKETILPQTKFEIEQRWSGIMGVGSQKKPIIKQLSDHVYCGVRLGGMGVALGSQVGTELAAIVGN